MKVVERLTGDPWEVDIDRGVRGTRERSKDNVTGEPGSLEV